MLIFLDNNKIKTVFNHAETNKKMIRSLSYKATNTTKNFCEKRHRDRNKFSQELSIKSNSNKIKITENPEILIKASTSELVENSLNMRKNSRKREF